MNLIGKGMTDNINHRKDFSMFQHINKTKFVIIFIVCVCLILNNIETDLFQYLII